MALFIRQYRLIVGNAKKAVEITENRIQFTIIKTLSQQPNRNEIKIWGLAETTQKAFEEKDVLCELYAGYREEQGPLLIFKGNVTYAYTNKEQPDVVTTIELSDGLKAIRDTVLSLSYGKNISNRQVIIDIAQKMGVTVVFGDTFVERSWENGFSFYGGCRDALNKAVRSSGGSWSIQNNILQIISQGGATSREAILLSADSGMIRSPERERQSAGEIARVQDQATAKARTLVSAAQQYEGYRVKSLLMPTIVAGDSVNLEARAFTGTLVAAEVEHHGDSEDGDWMTTLKLVNRKTASDIVAKKAKADEARTKRVNKAAAKAAAAAASPSKATNAGGSLLPLPPPSPPGSS